MSATLDFPRYRYEVSDTVYWPVDTPPAPKQVSEDRKPLIIIIMMKILTDLLPYASNALLTLALRFGSADVEALFSPLVWECSAPYLIYLCARIVLLVYKHLGHVDEQKDRAIGRLQGEVTELSKQKSTAENTISTLQADLEIRIKDCSEYQTDYAHKFTDCLILEKNLEEEKQLVRKLERSNELAEREHAELEDIVGQFRRELKIAREKSSRIQKFGEEELAEHVKISKTKVRSLKNKFQKEKNSIEEAHTTSLEELRSRVTSLQSELEEVKDEKRGLETTQANIQAEKDRLAGEKDDALESARNTAKTLDNEENRAKALEKELKEVTLAKEYTEECRDNALKLISSTKEALDRERDTNKTLNEENRIKAPSALEKELKEVKLAKVHAEVCRDNALKLMSSTKEALDHERDTNKALNKDLDELKIANAGEKQARESQKPRIGELETKVGEREHEIAQLKEALDRERGTNKTLTKDLEELKIANEGEKHARESQKPIIGELETKIGEREREIAQLKEAFEQASKAESVCEKCTDYNRFEIEARAEYERLNVICSGKQQRIEALEAEGQRLEKEHNDLKSQATDVDMAFTKTRESLDLPLDSNLEGVRKAALGWKDLAAQLEVQLGQMKRVEQERVAKAQEANLKRQAAGRELRAARDEKQHEIELLKRENKELSEKAKELTKLKQNMRVEVDIRLKQAKGELSTQLTRERDRSRELERQLKGSQANNQNERDRAREAADRAWDALDKLGRMEKEVAGKEEEFKKLAAGAQNTGKLEDEIKTLKQTRARLIATVNKYRPAQPEKPRGENGEDKNRHGRNNDDDNQDGEASKRPRDDIVGEPRQQ